MREAEAERDRLKGELERELQRRAVPSQVLAEWAVFKRGRYGNLRSDLLAAIDDLLGPDNWSGSLLVSTYDLVDRKIGEIATFGSWTKPELGPMDAARQLLSTWTNRHFKNQATKMIEPVDPSKAEDVRAALNNFKAVIDDITEKRSRADRPNARLPEALQRGACRLPSVSGQAISRRLHTNPSSNRSAMRNSFTHSLTSLWSKAISTLPAL